MGYMLEFRKGGTRTPLRAKKPKVVEPSSSIEHLWQKEPAHKSAAAVASIAEAKNPEPRKPRSRFLFWIKTMQALALAVAVCLSLGASDASSRFTDLGHRLMCTCSCAQLLGECNHVGCPESGRMRDELSAAISGGATDKQILDSFASKYGATVLAAPTTEGFNLVAWIAPFAVFAAALLGTILLVRHWSVGKSRLGMQAAGPEMDALRDRIRRETGGEGGY